MKFHRSITGKLMFLLVSFVAVLLGSFSLLAYMNGRISLQQATTAELLSTALQKQSALERWLTEARIDITTKSITPIVVEQAAILLSAPAESPEKLAAHDRLLADFQPLVGPQTKFIDLLFIHPDTGEVLASTNPSEEGKFKEDKSFFINGRIKPYVSEVYYSISLHGPVIAAAAPVMAEDGRLLGVLAGRLDLDILNTLINQRTGLHYSDDTYLVNVSSLLITQPRFIHDSAVLQQSIQTTAVKRCLDGNSDISFYDDYRGEPVIGAYRWLPAYQICLITEIDQAEAFAPSLAFTRMILLTSVLSLLVAIFGAFLLARTFTHPIRDLQTGAKRLGQGELDYRVAVKSKDEIGSLATSFNEMADSLEKQVAERKRVERVREALYIISQVAATTESLQDLYRSIHHALGNLMPAENFYIALYDADTDLISFPYFVDQIDEPSPPKKPGRGLTEYVLHTGCPLLADPKTFSQMLQQGEVELVGNDSVDWLGVPLKTGTKVFGVIAVQSYTESLRFGTAEKELLEYVSTQVAGAIERKLIQQRIVDALEFNNTLIEASTLGVLAYDTSGQCILANKAIAGIIGGTREQVLNQNYNQIKSWKKSGLLESAREAITTGHETRREIHAKSTFGKEIWLDCRLTPFVSTGEPHLLLTIDDISIQKQAELTLQTYTAKLEQSNRDLQEFAYVASHDLQEPLRKVQAFSDRLATKYTDALDDTGRDYLKRMRDASQRMQILINDLLGFSRVSTRAQPFTEVDLNLVAHEVLTDLEIQIERTRARVEIDKLPLVEADPTQMHQVLQNLIGNALKFHKEKHTPRIRVSAKIEGETCHISIEDNGIGFDTQYLDRIFKPFQRLHNREEYEGSGMGLAICRRIIERHGGSITATSSPGKGATFLVTLPIHQPKGDT